MSHYLNRAQLIGDLDDDPEIRTTVTGRRIATLSVTTYEALDGQHSDQHANRSDRHRVVIFDAGLVCYAARHLTKGAKVMVEGRLTTRNWTDAKGISRFSTEIQIQPQSGLLTLLEKHHNAPIATTLELSR